MVICCVAAAHPVLTYAPSTLRCFAKREDGGIDSAEERREALSGARGALHLTHSWTGSDPPSSNDLFSRHIGIVQTVRLSVARGSVQAGQPIVDIAARNIALLRCRAMADGWLLRWAPACAAVFAARTLYAGLIHGPLVLTPLVYARFPIAMNPTMNLPALLAVEALISVLLVGAYSAYFGNRRPSIHAAAVFGAFFGVAVYVPQNVLNLILLAPVHGPLAAAWVGGGIVGAVLSALVLRGVCSWSREPGSA